MTDCCNPDCTRSTFKNRIRCPTCRGAGIMNCAGCNYDLKRGGPIFISTIWCVSCKNYAKYEKRYTEHWKGRQLGRIRTCRVCGYERFERSPATSICGNMECVRKWRMTKKRNYRHRLLVNGT